MLSANRVLLVDDDAFAHYVLALLLEEARAPIKLQWVDTIEKALESLSAEPVDVCLLDSLAAEAVGGNCYQLIATIITPERAGEAK